MDYKEFIKPYLIDFDKLEVGQTIWSVEFGNVEVKIATEMKGTKKIVAKITEGRSFVGNFHNHLFFTANPFENLQRVVNIGEIKTEKQPFATYDDLIAENTKGKLNIGDKIQRFEVQLTKEYDSLYEIISVTKTLAKTENKIFLRDLIFDSTHPKNTKNKIIARVKIKGKSDWGTPDYFLVETN